MFFQNGRLHVLAQRRDRFGAGHFAIRVKRAFDPVAGNFIGDLEQLRLHLQQRHLSFWFANLRGEFLLNSNHLARVLMRELERLHEVRFRNFVGRAFDHDDVVFQSHVNQIEIALLALGVSRVCDELAVHAANAHRADRPGKRNVRNAKRGRRAVDRENIRIVLAIRAQQRWK